MNTLRVMLDEQSYTIREHDLIGMDLFAYPVFKAQPNELPSAARERWKAEHVALGLKQGMHLASLLAWLYLTLIYKDDNAVTRLAFNKEAKMYADSLCGLRLLEQFRIETVPDQARRCTAIQAGYQHPGSQHTHSIFITKDNDLS